MIPLLTAEETRRAEEAHEGSLDELMERAGRAVAELVLEQFPGRVAVVCGAGNNGGDGRVCARVLRAAKRDVTVVEEFGKLGEPDVVVDALLGIGLHDAPREDVWRLLSEPYQLPDWWPGIGGLEPDRRGFAPGARWHVVGENRPSFFRKPNMSGTLLVLAVEPYERFAFHLTGERIDVELRLSVEERSRARFPSRHLRGSTRSARLLQTRRSCSTFAITSRRSRPSLSR